MVIGIPHPPDARAGAEGMPVVMQHEFRAKCTAQIRGYFDLTGCRWGKIHRAEHGSERDHHSPPA
jgi:hypothetical protein